MWAVLVAMGDELIVGGCQCGTVRFELRDRPLFTHACHCLDCRRRSGSAFGMTTFVLRNDLKFTQGELVHKPTSPRTTVYRCAACNTTLYSSSVLHPSTLTLRGGTFDDPNFVEPGAHIWVKRKHHWIVIPEGVQQFEEVE